MQCDEIKKLLEKFVDNELNPTERKSVEEHISGCIDCKTELTSILEINAVSGLNYLPDPGDEYWSALTRDISGKISRSDGHQTVKQPRRSWMFGLELPTIRYAGIAVSAVLLFFLVKTSFFKENGIDPLNTDMRSLSKAEYSLDRDAAEVKRTAAKPVVGRSLPLEEAEEKSLPSARKELEDKVAIGTGTQKDEIKPAATSPQAKNAFRMSKAVDAELLSETSDVEAKSKTYVKVIPEKVMVQGANPPPVGGVVLTGGAQKQKHEPGCS